MNGTLFRERFGLPAVIVGRSLADTPRSTEKERFIRSGRWPLRDLKVDGSRLSRETHVQTELRGFDVHTPPPV